MSLEKDLLEQKWDEIILYMKDAFNLSDLIYNTFIKALKVIDVNGSTVSLTLDMENSELNTDKTIEYIKAHFSEKLILSIQIIMQTDDDIRLEFLLNGKEIRSSVTPVKKPDTHRIHPHINPKYTFDTYIAGDENAMVYNACLSVAEHPGDPNMNPLFIYGNSGLGKTHLMHAIANKILDNDDTKNVLYVTSEEFTNEIIEAIRLNKSDNKSTNEFRKKYREVDVLLVDDIQSIIGKEAVQNEFFNTFNALYDNNSQIVLTCDKRPKDLKVLEDRMSSRFLSGLPVDVKMPTFETRMAILREKVEESHIESKISNEILEYIANNISSNIRELEGAMHKVDLLTRSSKEPVTLEQVKHAIADMVTNNHSKTITIDLIVNAVCEVYGVTYDDIISSKRTSDIVEPRHMCMYLSHKYTQSSLVSIGEKLGKRDHATVINGEKKMAEKLDDPDKYPDVEDKYREIVDKLGIKN